MAEPNPTVSEIPVEIVPRILTMVVPRWPAVCGKPSCVHPQCMLIRESAVRRCSECEQFIAPGQQYTQNVNPVTKALVSQAHVTCPSRKES